MEQGPTYEELLAANGQLKEKIEWLEGIYAAHKDEGLQIKSRFLSNINHEFRTPMNAILGFSDLLKSGDLTESERDEYVQFISHNSYTLLKMMDNIIDLSLIEGDHLNLREDEVLITELLQKVYEFFNSRVSRTMQYRVALLLTLPPNSERIEVKVDGRRLRRLIENLVGNAMNFQKKGVIEIRMEINDGSMIGITVYMKHNELLAERAKKIFENNGTQDDWYNHLDSMGIGFVLAKSLSMSMGGSVSLVQGVCKRMGICIKLPVKNTGIDRNKPRVENRALLI